MCLPPQSLFGQFQFPITYHLCNRKMGKFRGNVVTMMICHIFEPISFFRCAVIATAVFSYSRGSLFVLCDGSLPFQAHSFKQLSNVIQVRKMYVAFEDLMKFPFAELSPKFF